MSAHTFRCPKCNLAFISKIRGDVTCRRCGTPFSTLPKDSKNSGDTPPFWLLIFRPITGLMSRLPQSSSEFTIDTRDTDKERSRRMAAYEPGVLNLSPGKI